jgi:hypothetical protein
MQIIDIDLGHAIQAQRRADAAQARLVKSTLSQALTRVHFWMWLRCAIGSTRFNSRSQPSSPRPSSTAYDVTMVVMTDGTLMWRDL